MAVENLEVYNADFGNKVHKIGKLTVLVAFLLSLSIPLYLTFVMGYAPSAAAVGSGLVFVASFVGMIWVIEPISYFPVLGSIGTYMSFVSGNIGNMRMPVVGAIQNALGLEPGTKKAEMASVFGLVSSNIVNLAILMVVVVSGQALINALPDAVLAAFGYAVPGILGAMLVSFGSNLSSKHLGIVSLVALAVYFVTYNAPGWFGQFGVMLNIAYTGVVAIVVIIVAYAMAVKAK